MNASSGNRKIPYGARTLAAIQRRVDETGEVVAVIAEHAEEYAKREAPWNDITGDARRLLSVTVDTRRYGPAKVTYRILARHGVPYGVFLENRPPDNGGRPILRPTLDVFGPLLRGEVRQVWRPYAIPSVTEVLSYMGKYASRLPK